MDGNFNALGAASVIACSATGSNAVVLVPQANFFTPTGYNDGSPVFSWIQAATSTGPVTISVTGTGGNLGTLAAYKQNGAVPMGAGDLVAGQSYSATFNHTLNSPSGGFVVNVVGISEAPVTGLAYGRISGAWGRVVAVAGDTMTGPLILSSDPSTPLGAATKQYVDAHSGGGGGGGATPPMPGLDGNLYGIQNQVWALVAPPSATLPTMDGTATAGIAYAFSRGDHAHPSDTSRAPVVNAALTGSVTVPTVAVGNNSTAAASTAWVLAEPLNLFALPTASTPWGGFGITGLANPTNPQDAVTKAYADATIQGLALKPTARLATTGALPANTYANGASGVGATLTASANGTLSIDSVPVIAGDLVLVKNEVTSANNGLYTVTATGGAGATYVLTRSTAMNTAAQFPGAFMPVSNTGSTNANTLWLADPTTPVAVGTTAIPITQTNSATSLIAGNGINISGNIVSAVGTTNQITVGSGGISIAATYVGQTSITTVGTITTGAWAGSPITVTGGGTGAASLTGYVKGAGTTPLTAVASIPSTDISGLGTMASQNAAAVAITGGSVNNVTMSSPVITGGTANATPAPGDNTLKLATTAFVLANGGGVPSSTVPLVDSGSGAIGTSLTYARADHVHPAPGGGAGTLVSINVYSASATITIPTGATRAAVQMWGATGGSGGTNNTTSAGTAAGGYLEKYLTGLTAGNTLIYTQGAAGAGGTGAGAGTVVTGGNATTTTLGSGTQTISTLTCTGSTGSGVFNGATQSTPGTATGGDINVTGQVSSVNGNPSSMTGGSNFYSLGANGVGGSGALAGNSGNPGGLKIAWYA